MIVQPKNFPVVCRRRDRGDKEFLPYHVTVVTPPPKHLGVHSLPPVRTFALFPIMITCKPYVRVTTNEMSSYKVGVGPLLGFLPSHALVAFH